jgi:hypothetical protein
MALLVATPGLDVALENDLPARLPAGTPTAVFVFGHCFHREAAVTGLALLVDGVRHRPGAIAMPRRDLEAWRRAQGLDPGGRSYRSGFWAVLPVPPPTGPGPVRLAAAVTVEGHGGDETLVELGEIPVTDPMPGCASSGPVDHDATIAVCMATYEPDPALFEAQIASLRAQTEPRWQCVVSDGGSSAAMLNRIAALLADDPRFTLSPAGRRMDPYRNFERALSLAPGEAPLIALCDQDDHWYPDKLATLRAALGDAMLVYSDLRLVADDGRVVRESLWEGRRNEWGNLASLLVANTIPGAAMLLRRTLLQTALPFPDIPGFHYHDHWLALSALAAGDVRYVDRPLYDYVQHDAAVMGDAGRPAVHAVGGSRGLRDAYFGGVVPREVQARTLLLRASDTLTPRRRRALEWFLAASRSPVAFAWLALRPLRSLAGRGETLGGEAALARGIAWRWVIGRFARGAADARFPDPPRFEQPRLRRWRGGA